MARVKAWPLLLLPFALVSMGNADCPFPVLNGTIVLSSESILKNSFPDNSEAFVECVKGYKRKNGPTSITCVNGVWSSVELICEKMDCGLPKPSPHMRYLMRDGTLFGAFIQPICDRGYDLEGSSHRQCLVSGWSGRATCLLTECELPDPIVHGSWVTPRDLPVFNDVITFSCDENYILVGNSSITCDEYGEYSAPPPKCIAVECQAPEINFGNQTKGNPPYFYKSEATFKCWPGYRMEGFATSVCEKSGWSALPVCVEVIITPTTASTTTNKATTSDMTTASTHSRIIITPTTASTTTNKATTSDMTTASIHSRIIITPTTASTTTNKTTTSDMTTASIHSRIIITPTTASTTTNKTTTSDMTTASIHSRIIITPTTASTTTNKTTTSDMTTASTHSRRGLVETPKILGAIGFACLIILMAVFVLLVFRNFKQKGSYNTGEELRAKEELLLNQSV